MSTVSSTSRTSSWDGVEETKAPERSSGKSSSTSSKRRRKTLVKKLTQKNFGKIVRQVVDKKKAIEKLKRKFGKILKKSIDQMKHKEFQILLHDASGYPIGAYGENGDKPSLFTILNHFKIGYNILAFRSDGLKVTPTNLKERLRRQKQLDLMIIRIDIPLYRLLSNKTIRDHILKNPEILDTMSDVMKNIFIQRIEELNKDN